MDTTYILTAELDDESFAWLDGLRRVARVEINGKRSQESPDFRAAPPDEPPTSTLAECSKQQQKAPLRTITIQLLPRT
jgi:hypothetical protein